MAASIQGSLKVMPLPDVLQWISLARKSGALIFKRDKLKKVIFFRKGDVIGANSNDTKDKVGEILARGGKITREDLEEGLKQQRETGELIGDIFLAKGLLSTRDFVAALERQATQIIYELFSWAEGEFTFQEKLPKARTIPISIKADFLLMEGIRRIDEWQLIKETFPNLDIILDWSEKIADEEGGEEQKAIRQLTNGKNTLLDICDQSPLNDFDTCNYLYQLYNTGKIRKAGVRSPHEIMEEDDVERLLTRGRAFYQNRRYSEAIPFFERVLKLETDNKEGERFLTRAIAAVQAELLDSLGSPNAVLELDKQFRLEEAKDLTAAEGFVLSRIDGNSTAKEVAFISGLSQTEACITLNGLLAKGIIRTGRDKNETLIRKPAARERETLDPRWKRMSYDLSDAHLSEILLDLMKQRQTGVLQLLHPPMDIRVYLQDGAIVSATSNMESDRCGSVLLRRGKINERQYEAVTALSDKEEILQGNALVQLRMISPNDLIWLTKTKVEEIVVSLFGWRQGKVHLYETDLRGFDLIHLKLSLGRFIIEGTWRYFEEKEILEVFKSWDVILDMAESPLLSRGDLELTENEADILADVNGRNSIEDTASRQDLEPLEVLKVLFGLYSAGLAVITGVASGDKEAQRHKTLEEFLEKRAKLQEQNYYQVLNLDQNASDREIKKSYYNFSKLYHPDKNFQCTDKEVLGLMLKIFLAGKEAYEVLSHRESRSEYDAFLLQAGPNSTISDYQNYIEPKIEVGHIMKAEDCFDKARTLLFSGRAGDALPLLEKALDLVPDDPDYNAYAGLAMARMRKDYQQAIGLIEKAIEADPKNADYRAFLGETHQRYGKKRQALAAFEEALDINPLHIQAKRECKRLTRPG
jgi:tetratricopeptide (TPR) repeat protein